MTHMTWTDIVEREHRVRRRSYAMALVLLLGIVAVLAAVISQL